MNQAKELLPKSKPLLGLFCNSRVVKKLRDEGEKSASTASNYFGSQDLFFGAPIWIDDRLPDDKSEAYYDKKLLQERIKEQNAYDQTLGYLNDSLYKPVFGAFD